MEQKIDFKWNHFWAVRYCKRPGGIPPLTAAHHLARVWISHGEVCSAWKWSEMSSKNLTHWYHALGLQLKFRCLEKHKIPQWEKREVKLLDFIMKQPFIRLHYLPLQVWRRRGNQPECPLISTWRTEPSLFRMERIIFTKKPPISDPVALFLLIFFFTDKAKIRWCCKTAPSKKTGFDLYFVGSGLLVFFSPVKQKNNSFSKTNVHYIIAVQTLVMLPTVDSSVKGSFVILVCVQILAGFSSTNISFSPEHNSIAIAVQGVIENIVRITYIS